MQHFHIQYNMPFKAKQAKVGTMVEAITDANKPEYLKPVTIAGFIFSRLVGDFLQGVQTPVSALVKTHYQASSPASINGESVYTFSFERVGNYLRTINDVLEPVGIEVLVVEQDDGFYAQFHV